MKKTSAYILDKVGVDCDKCVNVGDMCKTCVRSVDLKKLEDRFREAAVPDEGDEPKTGMDSVPKSWGGKA